MKKLHIALVCLVCFIANLNVVVQPKYSHYVLGLQYPSYAVTINKGAFTLVTPYTEFINL